VFIFPQQPSLELYYAFCPLSTLYNYSSVLQKANTILLLLFVLHPFSALFNNVLLMMASLSEEVKEKSKLEKKK